MAAITIIIITNITIRKTHTGTTRPPLRKAANKLRVIDLHCHILPGIDDGPKTLGQSLAMARHAVSHGIRLSIATPHIHLGCYDNDCDNIRDAQQKFQQALAEEGIALQLGMAAEVRVDAHLPGLVEAGKLPFIGSWEGLNALLIEFPDNHLPAGSEALVRWLIGRGILPVIAHPERNRTFVYHPDKLMPFVELGCLMQITAASLTGLFGPDVRQFAVSLARQGLVTFMASDAHNLEKRIPNMLPALDRLYALIGRGKADDLVKATRKNCWGKYRVLS